ncbi:MAG: RrF2 family transcriptional regulator [Gemmataceae bacterium]
MKISAQEEYGLRCLLQLARIEKGQSLTIPEVATLEGLSIPYVAKLLAVLRQAGLIESVRGRTGGYRLACEPEAVNLGSILLILGEPLFDDPGYCERHKGTEVDGLCVHKGSCSLRALWHTLEAWMRDALNRITLADLLHSEHSLSDLLRARLREAVLEEPVSALIPLTSVDRP